MVGASSLRLYLLTLGTLFRTYQGYQRLRKAEEFLIVYVVVLRNVVFRACEILTRAYCRSFILDPREQELLILLFGLGYYT